MHVNKVLWEGREATNSITAVDLIPLPTKTPFGNLQLKLLKIRERVAHINDRIDEAWNEWRRGASEHQPDSHHEPLVIEEVMYSIRRATDEVIGVRSLLIEEDRVGRFPVKLAIDSIDGALRNPDPLIERHREFLEFCNGASNAYKHSFLQTDVSLIGADEPCVFARRLQRNDLGKTPELYSASLNSVVAFFSNFLADSIVSIREFGRNDRTTGAR